MDQIPPESADRRLEKRRRCLLGGTVTFRERKSFYDCLIRNISSAGALIEFPDTLFPTEDFELHIRQLDRSFKGQIAWQRREKTGVMLAAIAFDDATTSLDDARRAKALKRENRALKKQLDYVI